MVKYNSGNILKMAGWIMNSREINRSGPAGIYFESKKLRP